MRQGLVESFFMRARGPRNSFSKTSVDCGCGVRPFQPNAETIAAMEEARRGEGVKSFPDFASLMADLKAEDDDETEKE